MKIRLFAVLMIALLSLALFSGCQASARGTGSENTVPTAAAPVPTETAPERITAEEAETIALAHAERARDSLSYLRTEFDYDDGVPEYDIEFYCDGWEYEYEIHAISGQILRSDAEPPREEKPAAAESPATEPPAATPPATEPPAANPSSTEPNRLTKEEVRDIALKHAGLTVDQVTGLRIEFDYDDGVPEYEVDFHSGGFEYDYEIHAETGVILSHDKDRED